MILMFFNLFCLPIDLRVLMIHLQDNSNIPQKKANKITGGSDLKHTNISSNIHELLTHSANFRMKILLLLSAGTFDSLSHFNQFCVSQMNFPEILNSHLGQNNWLTISMGIVSKGTVCPQFFAEVVLVQNQITGHLQFYVTLHPRMDVDILFYQIYVPLCSVASSLTLINAYVIFLYSDLK